MSQRRPSRIANLWRRFARANRGVTAVEFALVSVPLLMLILGTLELGVVILVMTSLQTATEMASRRIRTGEFQTSGNHAIGDFQTLVCSRMNWLQTRCNSNLTVEVRVFNDFQTLAANQPLPGSSFRTGRPATTFAPGQPCDIVLVRAYLPWPVYAPLLTMLDNTGAGTRLVSFATAFRNEPYDPNAPGATRC